MHKSIRNSKENEHNALSQMCGKLYLPENWCSAVPASFAENIQVNQFSICSDQVMVQIFLSVKKKIYFKLKEYIAAFVLWVKISLKKQWKICTESPGNNITSIKSLEQWNTTSFCCLWCFVCFVCLLFFAVLVFNGSFCLGFLFSLSCALSDKIWASVTVMKIYKSFQLMGFPFLIISQFYFLLLDSFS